MKNKAQVKFGESIGVIIIVFFIIMIGLIWYNNINTSSLQKISQNNQFNKAFEKYYYLKELDLIHDSQRGIVGSELNLNALKVFSNYSKSSVGKAYLLSRLSYGVITMSIYNSSGLGANKAQLNLTLYNNTPNSNTLNIAQTVIFISYFPVKDENKTTLIGKLNVKSYILG